MSAERRKRVQSVLDRDRNLEVLRATRDAVAFRNKQTGEVDVAFRGTKPTMISDLWTDAKLAMNAKNIPRLNQARQFTQQVVKDYKVPQNKLYLTGHSLVS